MVPFDAGQDAPRPLPLKVSPSRADAAQKHPPYRQASLKIVLRDPKYDPLKQVVVKINGKQVALVKGIKRLQKNGVTLKKRCYAHLRTRVELEMGDFPDVYAY